RPEVSLLQRAEPQVRRIRRAGIGDRSRWPVAFAQLAGKPDLQLLLACAAAASAASGDADVPGRLGDPGDGYLPGASAAAAAAASGTRARLSSVSVKN